MVALFFVGPHTAEAQEAASGSAEAAAYRDTVVVAPDDDSLTGRVMWGRGAPTPSSVRLKAHPGAEPTEYAPSKVRAVHLTDGRRLVGRAVQVDQVPDAPAAAQRYIQSQQPPVRADTLLLEVVVDGPLRLYATHGERTRFFVASGTVGASPSELIRRRVRREGSVYTSHRFRAQLQARMDGCPAVRADAKTATFRRTALKDLVVRYNRCAVGDGAFFVQDKRAQFEVQFGGTAGGTRSRVSLPVFVGEYEWFGWGQGYVLGLTADVRVLRWARWRLRAMLAGHWQRLEGESDFSGTRFEGAPGLELWWLRSMLLTRYNLMMGTWRPYLEGGASVAYRMGYDAGANDPYLEAGRRTSFGLVLGVGLRYHDVQVSLRAERTRLWGRSVTEIHNVYVTASYFW
jgi:hypothetical protein